MSDADDHCAKQSKQDTGTYVGHSLTCLWKRNSQFDEKNRLQQGSVERRQEELRTPKHSQEEGNLIQQHRRGTVDESVCDNSRLEAQNPYNMNMINA